MDQVGEIDIDVHGCGVGQARMGVVWGKRACVLKDVFVCGCLRLVEAICVLGAYILSRMCTRFCTCVCKIFGGVCAGEMHVCVCV